MKEVSPQQETGKTNYGRSRFRMKLMMNEARMRDRDKRNEDKLAVRGGASAP